MNKVLKCRDQVITFPTFVPITTFSGADSLDDQVRPYLPRLAQAAKVGYHDARKMRPEQRPDLPLWVDSGSRACLLPHARVLEKKCGRHHLGVLEVRGENGAERISPAQVLAFQEEVADLAFTLDFPIPPNTDPDEANVRVNLSVTNALWALQNRRRGDLPLFAGIQGWDLPSYMSCAQELVGHDFDGFAIGGLVPQVKNFDLVMAVVSGIRTLTDKPLHVFDIGCPETVQLLFQHGADSVDSASPLKLAAQGKIWGRKGTHFKNPSPTERLHLALCNLGAASAASWQLQNYSFLCQFLSGRAA